MNGSILWIFLVTAPLVSAGSLGSFQATCSLFPGEGYGGCGGTWDSSFSFGGPFFPGPQVAPGLTTLTVEFEVGTSGGVFSYMGSTCDYDTSNHTGCDGEIQLGSPLLGPPAGTGLSAGAVVNVVGLSPAEGFYCDPCSGDPSTTTSPIFDQQVLTTYQFTVTAPGTPYPFSWTGAEFTSVPEPGTWAFTILGLLGLAFIFGRGRTTAANPLSCLVQARLRNLK
jgi:hypothetical protein